MALSINPRSLKRRVASADISNYKKVYRNELVVGFPIDEGVLGFQFKYPFAGCKPGVHRVEGEGVEY